ncbi:MAG: NUDIX domain-containing protein [Coriobacteriia bacterium]
MSRLSAGILLYRFRKDVLEVLLVHPGGPLYARKDDGVWSIPKGEYLEGEEPLHAALRELAEETGLSASPPFLALTPRRQPSGKVVSAWAAESGAGIGGDTPALRSNTFSMEWPPKSGKVAEFPEVDRAEWFDTETAKRKLLSGQAGFVDELESLLSAKPEG